MQIMRMSYNDLTNGGGKAKLHVYGVVLFLSSLVKNHIRTILTAHTFLIVVFLLDATG